MTQNNNQAAVTTLLQGYEVDRLAGENKHAFDDMALIRLSKSPRLVALWQTPCAAFCGRGDYAIGIRDRPILPAYACLCAGVLCALWMIRTASWPMSTGIFHVSLSCTAECGAKYQEQTCLPVDHADASGAEESFLSGLCGDDY